MSSQPNKITYTATHFPGQTLNIDFNPANPPFNMDSLPVLFDKEQFAKISLTNSGEIKQTFELVQDAKSQMKALGVEGQLDLTCGPVSGDANVKFAMNNLNSELSLSIIYKMSRYGHTRVIDLHDLSRLKLDNTIAEGIKTEKITPDDFTNTYGNYIVVGFESGGDILFNTTFTTKTSEDKTSVKGGLSIQFEKVPSFSISGSANGEYKKEDVSKALNVKQEFKFNPSTSNPDQTELIKCFNDLTSISSNKTPDDIANLKNKIDTYANSILNPSENKENANEFKLDWTRSIIYPITCVPCVSKAFQINSSHTSVMRPFFKQTNPLFLNIKSKYQDMTSIMTEYWTDPEPPQIFYDYAEKFYDIIQIFNSFSLYTNLQHYVDKYNDYMTPDNPFEEPPTKKNKNNNHNCQKPKQIEIKTKEFYKINTLLLNKEYRRDILIPYNTHYEETKANYKLGKKYGKKYGKKIGCIEKKNICGIQIVSCSGRYINGIHIMYDDGKGWRKCGNEGNNLDIEEFVCGSYKEFFNEVILKIENNKITYIECKTNKGNSVSGGDGRGNNNRVKENIGRLCGIKGLFSNKMEQLQFKWKYF